MMVFGVALAHPRRLAVVGALCELNLVETVENTHGQAIDEAWGYNPGRMFLVEIQVNAFRLAPGE